MSSERSPRHGRCDIPTAIRIVLGTSIVGLVTIPLWLAFGLHMIS
ncbi:MAG: hypothetical protein WCS31_17105 [Verrucomicrobiae bacterium]